MSALVRALASAKYFFGVILIISIGVAAGLLLGTNFHNLGEDPVAAPGVGGSAVGSAPAAPSAMPIGTQGEEQLESPFVSVAQKVLPAVVNVDTKRTVTYRGFDFDQSPYGDFFRRLFPETPDREVEVPTYGSGFIFDNDGHIMTNNHVVRDAEEIVVTLSDGTQYDAVLVGQDAATDVAVIKIDPEKDLPALTLGDSDAMRVGDWVVAVGNPFHELEGTLTVGVVSAMGRSDLRIAGGAPIYQKFIQTDASINYGNSGGPLCNLRGEVIGINTAINPSGQGIGFAIPVNLAKKIGKQLMETGEVVRGYLGILPQQLTDDLAEGMGLEGETGILVGSVERDTPAMEAGLEEGDVIVKFDGVKVKDVDEFRMLVADTPVGEDVPIEVLRGGKRKDLTVTLSRRPQDYAEEQSPDRDNEDWLGCEVHRVTEDIARELGIQDEKGVVVVDVRSGSPAETAGLARGDVIISVGGTEVSSVADFNKTLGDSYKESMSESEGKRRAKPIVFLVERQGRTMFVPIRPPKE
jgi:serine protease Do